MTPDQLSTFCATIPRLKKKGSASRPAWYVDNRLVVRLEDAETLTIRCAFDLREVLVAQHPETFGVPPRFESHLKVQADLTHGHDAAIERALLAAYDLQRKADQ